MNKVIDLRSDTITKPTPEMRKAMYEAEVGDDVFKEDPTLNELQNYAAELLGKEAALFVPSGTMGNQLCLNVLTNPGDEVICERDAHIFHYESASPAALSGIQLNPLQGTNGVMNPDEVEKLIRPASAYYMPNSKVIEVENTHNRGGGVIQPLGNIMKLQSLAERYNLYYHLDGARIWNASVETGISLEEYASYFDTVSCCLSKGLGAPVGSIIAGPKEFIDQAFKKRKAWGGGMRQAGIIAAGGLYALKNNIDRLKEDHQKAKMLADKIDEIEGLEIDKSTVQTNILIFKTTKFSVEDALAKLKDHGLALSVGTIDSLRAITHLDASFEDVEEAGRILEKVYA
jgi:threonine aldolase